MLSEVVCKYLCIYVLRTVRGIYLIIFKTGLKTKLAIKGMLHGELFGELGNFLETLWYSSYLEDYNAMMLEMSERHRGDKETRMCWKYREV